MRPSDTDFCVPPVKTISSEVLKLKQLVEIVSFNVKEENYEAALHELDVINYKCLSIGKMISTELGLPEEGK